MAARARKLADRDKEPVKQEAVQHEGSRLPSLKTAPAMQSQVGTVACAGMLEGRCRRARPPPATERQTRPAPWLCICPCAGDSGLISG